MTPLIINGSSVNQKLGWLYKKRRFFAQSNLFCRLTDSPLTLIDVGSRGGIHPRWQSIPNLKIIGFEPDSYECKLLNEKSGQDQIYFPIALSNNQESTPLYLTSNPACSSIFVPNFPFVRRFKFGNYYEIVKTIETECNTLDQVIAENQIEDVDFLKIDTQGSELRILEGAQNVLRNSIFGVDIEAEFSPLYKNQPLFADVDTFLRKSGFTPFDYDLARLPREKYQDIDSKGQVLWTHAIYLKDFCDGSWEVNQFTQKKALKAIAIAELCGFPDYALELLDFFGEDLIGKQLYAEFRNIIYNNHKKRSSPELKVLEGFYRLAKSYLIQRVPCLARMLQSIKGENQPHYNSKTDQNS